MKLGYYVPSGEMRKRYVVTEVRSIQNAIFSLAKPIPHVHANDLPRKMLLRPECRSLFAFRTVKSPFRASWAWKCAGKLKSKLKGSMTCSWSEKEPKKGQKVLLDLEGKLVRNIRFCATFCTSYPKKKCTVQPLPKVKWLLRGSKNRFDRQTW